MIAGPSVSIEPDYAKLAQFGITPASLQYQLQSSLEGNIAGNIFEKEQVNTIRMLYPGSRKISVADLSKLQIFSTRRKIKTNH